MVGSVLISWIPILIILFILYIFICIKIGKAIGIRLAKDAGLILGIVLIIIGVTIFIGIPVIIYSNKEKKEVELNVNLNKKDSANTTIKHEYFIGKNYKDILSDNNLGEYINIFTQNRLTEISIITELTDSDLEKIGITIMGDRKKILKIFSS